MSFNLLELAKGAIGQQVMANIGSILGEDEKATSAAISAGLPSLIGGLINKSSTPAGADALSGLLDQQDDSILDNLSGLLGGGNHESFLGQGSGLLGNLLGTSMQGKLIRMLCKATGLGDGKVATALSILAPIVMSVLKRQRTKQGIGAGGLGGLLGGQKRHISSSLPAGVGDLFELGTDGRQTRGTSSQKSGGSLFSKFLPLLVVLGLGMMAFKFLTSRDAPAANDEVVIPGQQLPGDSGLGGPSTSGSGVTISPGPLSTESTTQPEIKLGPPAEPAVEIEPGPLSPAKPAIDIEPGPLSPN